jgi:uncharacterized protein with HEPN domain
MTRDLQRLGDYLAHMLEAIERIEEYVSDMDEMAFLGNRLVQDAVIRNFEIIWKTIHRDLPGLYALIRQAKENVQ